MPLIKYSNQSALRKVNPATQRNITMTHWTLRLPTDSGPSWLERLACLALTH
jgi:hypothetical protein